MATPPNAATCQALIQQINDKLNELMLIPLDGMVGKTKLNHMETVKLLERRLAYYTRCLEAAQRRAGRLGPRRREVF